MHKISKSKLNKQLIHNFHKYPKKILYTECFIEKKIQKDQVICLDLIHFFNKIKFPINVEYEKIYLLFASIFRNFYIT